ncbi:plasma membrane localization protein [Linderina macrospora]|uniref:Plasma membrane localization protein n=1 Tax=Linderina macrospora TaxID=4868 RepID=A0ACC1J582_9FUNG|nr:plasma membrane localization protein [Linderina macrospora]
MLERIDTQSSAGKHSDGAQVGTKRRATTIRVLESLFCKPYILVGISVMEVLNILVTFLLESIGEDPSTESDFDMFSKTLQISSEPASNRLGDSLERLPTYYHLLSAIGGLAKHQYYSDQLADMVGYLIKQMKLEASTRADSLGTAADGARQAWLLQALSLVLANSTATSASGRTPMTVPLSIYVPLFTLLSRDQWDVRALAADCIVGLLRHDHQASDGFALRSSAAVDAWSSELAAAIRQKLSDALQHAKSAEGDADYAAVAAIMYELLATHVPATAQLVLELLKQSDSSSGDAGAMAMQAMVWQKIADECRAAGLDKVVIAVASEAKDSGSWSRHVEYACLGQTRIVAIATAQPAATTPGSPTLAQKLSYETLCTHLSLNLPDISPSDSQKADHVLLNHHQHHSRNTSSVTPEPARARKAVDRVNDMRARISIDWETQAKRDSALAPHVNMDQLRAALRTGLNMRSAEFNEDLENNADLDDDIGTAGRSLRTASTDYQKATAKDVDAYGVPVPDEVRALLDSLDESVGSPYHQHGGQLDHQTNSSISTPVVSHVD